MPFLPLYELLHLFTSKQLRNGAKFAAKYPKVEMKQAQQLNLLHKHYQVVNKGKDLLRFNLTSKISISLFSLELLDAPNVHWVVIIYLAKKNNPLSSPYFKQSYDHSLKKNESCFKK